MLNWLRWFFRWRPVKPASPPAPAVTVREIGTAGAPIDIASNYDLVFSQLKEAGISAYLPLGIYQEIPTVLSHDLESDWYPAPYGRATEETYDIARRHGIKIVYAANSMYPLGRAFPPETSGALRAVIDAGGRDIIHSVYNYDEPATSNARPEDSRAVYEHVKNIDPTIPVYQTHAAIFNADPAAYLAQVRQHADYADVVGFNVYPVSGDPGELTPYSAGAKELPAQAVTEYVDWLKTELPHKKHMMTLQAFELADMYSPELLATFSPDVLAMSVSPSLDTLRAMLTAADVSSVFWYGPSYQREQSGGIWDKMLMVSRGE